jgi:sugar phosphate isomerase/epimerase
MTEKEGKAMAIKRGVSFYSYQQEQFFGRMNWKDMIRELHDNLHCDGVEIIDESTIPHYPFPPQEFIYDWNNELARYNMKAVTKDIYLDVHQFRDHVMNHREAAERLKYDIKLAAQMGFENVRCLCMVPIDAIEMALDTAVKYNVRIGKEIHAPYPIKYDPGREGGQMVVEVIDLIKKTGTKHLGLVPDMGIFQHSPARVNVEHQLRIINDPKLRDFVENRIGSMAPEDVDAAIEKDFPNLGHMQKRMLRMFTMTKSAAQPEDILEIVPYILSIHGKFYEMTEIPGKPGQYEDKSIDYANPIEYLKKGGYDGYINSEYEGQRSQQDRGYEYLANEVEEVRRHHEMLARLIG